MHTHQLTNELFNDLLDPCLSTLDVCRKHAVPITDLRLILASEHFQQTARALIEAEELRSAALAPDRRERALATLDAITQQTPTTPTHTECIRRAAATLLRATKPAQRPARAPAKPEPAAPDEDAAQTAQPPAREHTNAANTPDTDTTETSMQPASSSSEQRDGLPARHPS